MRKPNRADFQDKKNLQCDAFWPKKIPGCLIQEPIYILLNISILKKIIKAWKMITN
jgi:hypothetical protein